MPVQWRAKLSKGFVPNLKINISTNTKPTKMNFTIMDFPRSALSNNIFNIKIGLINAEIYTKEKEM